MAQEFLYHLDVHVRFEGEARGAVPQVVQPDRGQPQGGHKPVEVLGVRGPPTASVSQSGRLRSSSR